MQARPRAAGLALRMATGVAEVSFAVKAAKTGALVYGVLIGAGGISAGEQPAISFATLSYTFLGVQCEPSLETAC